MLSPKKEYSSALELGARDGNISMLLADLNYSNIYCTDLNNNCGIKLRNSTYSSKVKFKQTDALDTAYKLPGLFRSDFHAQ